jgi:hypothetical protein
MLVKTSDDHLDGVVGLGNELTLDGIDQLGPMALQEIENDNCFGLVLDKLLPQRRDLVIALLSSPLGFGLKNGDDVLSELLHLRLGLGIISPIQLAARATDIL